MWKQDPTDAPPEPAPFNPASPNLSYIDRFSSSDNTYYIIYD